MEESQTNDSLVALTKEECLAVTAKCATKEEVKEKFPEIAAVIKQNKWHYMYFANFLGKSLKEENSDVDTRPKESNLPPPTPQPKKPISKIYKLKSGRQPLSFTLNVGRDMKLLVWDEQKEQSRAIRHCPNERTIYLDKQNKDTAVVEPIVFLKGFYFTDERKAYTQEFLEAMPKFNVLYELVNAEGNAKKLINVEDLIIDIKQAIREKSKSEMGIEEIRAIVSVLTSDPLGASKMTPSELRFAAYGSVDKNPNRFTDDTGRVNIFEDSQIKRTAMAQHAFLSGIIQPSVDGREVMWSDNKATICTIPPGLGYMAVFSDFLATEEGITVARELTRR